MRLVVYRRRSSMSHQHGKIVALDLTVSSFKDSRDQASFLLKCIPSSLSVLTTQHLEWQLSSPSPENPGTRSLVILNWRQQRRGILNFVSLRALSELFTFFHKLHTTTGIQFKTLLMVTSTFVSLILNRYKQRQRKPCVQIYFLPSWLSSPFLLLASSSSSSSSSTTVCAWIFWCCASENSFCLLCSAVASLRLTPKTSSS